MIRLHEGQSEVFEDLFVNRTCRFSVVCCSRGWGKSFDAGVVAMTAIFELMELPESVPNKVVYIIAPTYDQVTDIYYPLLNYDLGLQHYCLRSSRDLGRFVFPGNVELRLLSYEAVERMRGKGAYLVIWDEVSSCLKGIDPKEAWQSVIEPCITTRWSPKRCEQIYQKYGIRPRSPGRALAISTPKGFNFFYEMFNYQEKDSLWKSYHYDYKQSPFLDPVEIERLRHKMDPIQFATEYLASFKESGASVFYCFDRKIHVRKDLPYFQPPDKDSGEKYGEDVHVCIDFNVGIQATSAFALRGGQVHVLEEFKGHPDTETLAETIRSKYIEKGHRVFAYPDPTGKARKSSAPVGRTDFSILRKAGIEVLARTGSPGIKDSSTAVNAKLMTAAGDVSFFISPECTGGIESLERTIWVDGKPDNAVIDKSMGVEHFSDGFRYAMEFLFPVNAGNASTARGFNF